MTTHNKFNTILEYYTYVMKRYFRKIPPVSTPVYLEQEVMEDVDIRRQVAYHCHFPSGINVLANDPDDEVRNIARNNEYWLLLGQYQDVLGFEKRERLEFAKNEGGHNLILILMFDEDMEVIKEALSNSSLTIQMLALYFQLLAQRGQGKKDRQLFELTRNILKERKGQIIKISQLQRAIREFPKQDTTKTILQYLGDDNAMVRKAVRNALHTLRIKFIYKVIYAGLNLEAEKLNKVSFLAMNELIKICKERDELKRTPVNKLNISMKAKLSRTYPSAAALFIHLLNKQRYTIAGRVATDMTNLENVIINAYCHVDNDRHLRELANRIMSVDDLLQLVNDPSVPRHYFKETLSILSRHPDQNVSDQVRDSYLNETKRMKKKLHELEMSVEAYFDIIFQSVGYTKINEYKDAINAISAAERQIKKFDKLLRLSSQGKNKAIPGDVTTIKESLKRQAAQIYYDTSPKVMSELEYIESAIDEIFQLKEIGLLSMRPGTPEDVESELRAKGRTIWQSAISSYLGRIKDLSEMLQRKIECLSEKATDKEELVEELGDAIQELEYHYKKEINCQLKIHCKQCSKRGCAADRFLREVRFLIDIIFDDFEHQKMPSNDRQEVIVSELPQTTLNN